MGGQGLDQIRRTAVPDALGTAVLLSFVFEVGESTCVGVYRISFFESMRTRKYNINKVRGKVRYEYRKKNSSA